MKIQNKQKICIKLRNYLGLKTKVLLPVLKPQMMCIYMILDQVLKHFNVLRFPPLHPDKLIYLSKQCSNVFRNFVLRLTQLLRPFFFNQEFFCLLYSSVQGSKSHFPVTLHVHMHDRYNIDYNSMHPFLGEQCVTKLSCSFYHYPSGTFFSCLKTSDQLRCHLCMDHQFFCLKWYTFDFHVSLSLLPFLHNVQSPKR